jgi:hypothetical protein
MPNQPVDASPSAATLVPGTHTVWIAGSVSVGADENETFTERIDSGRPRVVPRAVWALGFHFQLLNGCGDAVSGSLIERY